MMRALGPSLLPALIFLSLWIGPLASQSPRDWKKEIVSIVQEVYRPLNMQGLCLVQHGNHDVT